MSDLYIKPGNHERGWNDPPHFSYGLQNQASGTKRNPLNKRAPAAPLTGHGSGPLPPTVTSSVLQGNNTASPPAPPKGGFTPPPPPRACDSPSGFTKTSSGSPVAPEREPEPELEEVEEALHWALSACSTQIKKQVHDDIQKRLNLFEEMWRSGRLSLPVKCRMNALAQKVRAREWESADELHRALMVDYVNEVSQWMVGVKRLIAETRNLSPERLQSRASTHQEQ